MLAPLRTRTTEKGMTLLEVLIALSIFALIGVGSYRVLAGVIQSQKVGEQHSMQLAQIQKALGVIDRDLQQVVNRPIRIGATQQLPALCVYTTDFPLELTRGGWQNPLQLPRSSMQRVAYDIGQHPRAGVEGSPFFGDKRQYLLRIFWPVLDRNDDVQPVVQALLPDIEAFEVSAISEAGRHRTWPLPVGSNASPPRLRALEFSVTSSTLGVMTRLYTVSLN